MIIGLDIQSLQNPAYATRGIGNFARELYQQLFELPVDDHYILFNLQPEIPYSLNRTGTRFKEYFLPGYQAAPAVGVSSPPILPKAVAGFLQGEQIDVFLIANAFDDLNIFPQGHYSCPVVILVHDLIPLIFPRRYLPSTSSRERYLMRVKVLRQADHILAISQNTKNDLIKYLNIPDEKISVIMAGVSPAFCRRDGNYGPVRIKYGIKNNFIFCNAGMEGRKNLDGLIRAFAGLRPELRKKQQLVITCEIDQAYGNYLQRVAHEAGVEEQLVLTNFIPLDDLVDLYNAADLAVFPSYYEGFGLPVAEAMACGVPVITSATSSMAEIGVGAALLINPYNGSAITAGMEKVLTDQNLRANLITAGLERAAELTWEQVACKTQAALEKTVIGKQQQHLRLAYFSPFNPARSGISDYSEELLPELAREAQVDVFIDDYELQNEEFKKNFKIYNFREYPRLHRQYDANLYQMGNSDCHEFMYPLLLAYPGLVTMHDYNLHGFMYHITIGHKNPQEYVEEMAYCYGEEGVAEARKVVQGERWPDWYGRSLNHRVIKAAWGIIVHNDYSLARLTAEHGARMARKILMGVNPVPPDERIIAGLRQKWGLDTKLVIAAFGHISHTKRNQTLLEAFAQLAEKIPEAVLLFVGPLEGDQVEFPELIKQKGLAKRVLITDYLDLPTFLQALYLTDIAVNLRYPYNGETSSTFLRLLCIGKPVIVSDIGAMGECPDNCCYKISVDPGQEEEELYYALYNLCSFPELRTQISQRAREWADENLTVARAAREYLNFIKVLKNKKVKYNAGYLAEDEENSSGLAIRSNGKRGFLHYGPYLTMAPGNYRVIYRLKLISDADKIAADAEVAILDVCCAMGNTILQNKVICYSEFLETGVYQNFELEFELADGTENVEFRVYDLGRVALAVEPEPLAYLINREFPEF